METTPRGALDTPCCLCGGGRPTPSGVYGRWRADLGDPQEDRGTRRMEYHRQGHCRLLRGGQSGSVLRSGSGIVSTTEGLLREIEPYQRHRNKKLKRRQGSV